MPRFWAYRCVTIEVCAAVTRAVRGDLQVGADDHAEGLIGEEGTDVGGGLGCKGQGAVEEEDSEG
jgi:hypothetical protein